VANRFLRYFDLGFESERGQGTVPAPDGNGPPADKPVRLPLGGSPRRRPWMWTVGAWLSLSCGIFLRQGLDLRSMDWHVRRLNEGSALAALVVGLAVLPPAMRWFNSKRQKAGTPQILAAFSLGFLLDIASLASINSGAWLKLG
jgi:hypothetical protein